MESEVKTRLLEFLHYKHLTQSEFCRRIGVSPTYIGAMRKSISDDRVRVLRRAFPELNTAWLLYGEGEMLNNAPAAENRPADAMGYEVPLLPVAAYAGNLQQWSDGVTLRDCEKVVSPVRGADFAIRVSGDSMEPVLHNGVTILIKRINEQAFIPWGSNLVIDTENGVLVKTVYPGAQGRKSIEARSVNPKYPPIEIPHSSIYGLYRILGAVQVYTTV